MSVSVIQYAGPFRRSSYSPPCWKIHLALQAKKIDYEVVNVTPLNVKKYNPRGRVPAAKINGNIIVDSTDILTALDKEFPEIPLNMESPIDRAQIKILEDWADEVIYFYMAYLRWCVPGNVERLKVEILGRGKPGLKANIMGFFGKRVAKKRFDGQGVGLKSSETVYREYGECLDALEDMLSDDRKYLVGGQLTRADISIYAHLDELLIDSLTPKAAQMIRERERLYKWCEAIAGELDSIAEFKKPDAK